MRTRRGVLAILGATAVAGCTSQAENDKNTIAEKLADRELTLPFNGAGPYEEKIRNADQLPEGRPGELEVSLQDVVDILDDEPQDQAQKLNEMLTNVRHHADDAPKLLKTFHTLYQGPPNNQPILNQSRLIGASGDYNATFYSDNGILQSQPYLQSPIINGDQTNGPNEQKPESLVAARNPKDGRVGVPEDMKVLDILKEHYRSEYDSQTAEEKLRTVREAHVTNWSAAIPGLGLGDNLRPWDSETSNTLHQGKFHGENAMVMIEIGQEFYDSEHYSSDVPVAVEMTDNGYEFREVPDHDPKDPLPGDQ